jgi:hypothetical protein
MTSDDPTTQLAPQTPPEDPYPPADSDDPGRVGAADPGPPAAKRAPRRGARLIRPWLGAAGVWLGLLVVAGGFGLIAFTWGRTAGLVNVAQQIPYLVSGGLVGLGLIMTGLLVISLSVKRREALDRALQLEQVREALVRLRAAIEEEPEDGA